MIESIHAERLMTVLPKPKNEYLKQVVGIFGPTLLLSASGLVSGLVWKYGSTIKDHLEPKWMKQYHEPEVAITVPELRNNYFTDEFRYLAAYIGDQLASNLRYGEVTKHQETLLLNEKTVLFLDFKHNNESHRIRVKCTMDAPSRTSEPFRQYHVYAYNLDIVNSFLDMATTDSKHREQQTRQKLYILSDLKFNRIPCGFERSFATVKLANDQQEDIEKDVMSFVNGQDRYSDKGQAWHRGYLLYGPPGTGKSSVIMAIAHRIKWSVYIIDLKTINTDEDLSSVFQRVPKYSIIVLEEIDTVPTLSERKETDESGDIQAVTSKKKKASWHLGTFLTHIDGLLAGTGRIVVMTTNHIDHIDKAVLRPGRTDRIFHLDFCDSIQARKIYQIYFPHVSDVESIKITQEMKINAAMITSICMKGTDAIQALTEICALTKSVNKT